MKTDTKVAHTPTPWHIMAPDQIRGPEGAFVADCQCHKDSQDRDLVNAELIVQAVNSHQALIEACEAANRLLTHSVSEQVESTWLELPNHAETLRLVRTALHLAKGEAHQ